jgi:hypothetical protein
MQPGLHAMNTAEYGFGYGHFDDGRRILLVWNDVEAMWTVFVSKM